jgi:hypothetical protein
MQNLNTQSVIKAAAIGAGINVFVGLLRLLELIPGIGDVLAVLNFVLFCCGGLLIPILTGALYGYFTPGKETLGQSALGGAVSGIVAGLIYGVVNSIVTAGVIAWNSGDIADALASSAGTLIGSCCGAFIGGAILGAIGGAIWTAVQKD